MTSDIAVVFPGQGAHEPSMVTAASSLPGYDALIGLLSDLAGENVLGRLAEEGDLYLRRNEIVASLTVIVSSLWYRRWLSENPEPVAVGGYSVGTWAALSAAGMISVEEMVTAIWHRSCIMNSVLAETSSAMSAVIGLPLEQVEQICADVSSPGDKVVVCNVNAPGQTTIGGHLPALLRAESALSAQGAYKIVRLNVSGAWHSFVLDPAIPIFESWLESLPLLPAKMPVANNVDGGLLPEEPLALRHQLALHLARPVLWSSCVRSLGQVGASCFVEVGHGAMLTKFGVFIDRKKKHSAYPGV